MSVRVIIDCSWLLVVCTISPEGKRRMRMNQDGLLSMALVSISFRMIDRNSKFPKKFPVMFWIPKVSRSDITDALHHPWPHVSLFTSTTHSPTLNNTLQYPSYQERGKDQESWLEIWRRNTRFMVWDSLTLTDFASLCIAWYGMASCLLHLLLFLHSEQAG